MSITKRFFAAATAALMLFSLFPLYITAQFENTHINTGSMASDIVAVAQTQIGYMEGTIEGTEQKYNDYTKYGQWYGMNYAPWCAMFVSWCANQAGIPISVVPKHASCNVGMNWFKNKGQWQAGSYYGGTYSPHAGDIVYFGFNSGGSDDSTHVGIVYGSDSTYIYVAEGNSSERVQTVTYTKASSYILGYATPAYEGSSIIYRDGTYITTATQLNFRTEPSISSSVITLIPQGTYLTVSEISDSWGKTSYNGYNGWVSMEYLSAIYSIAYDANGGTGAPSTQYKIENEPLTITSTVPTRDGYTFLGWGVTQYATSSDYAPSSSYTPNAGIVLYAVWQVLPSYTVTFDANGGTGAPAPQGKIAGTTLTLSEVCPTRGRWYEFLGWSNSYEDTEARYTAGGLYTLDSDAYLYAIWRDIAPRVICTSNEGGEVKTVTERDGENINVTVYVTANRGYTISRVVADGALIPLSGDLDSCKYVYTALTYDASFNVKFSSAYPDWNDPFTDVLPGDWYYFAVRYGCANGYFSGVSQNSFSPSSPISRAMFLTSLGRIYEAGMGRIVNRTNDTVFIDVPSDAYYYRFVMWAYNNGITGGTSGGMFAPNDPVTREQLSLMLYKYALYTGGAGNAVDSTVIESFTDTASISSWARTAVEWATGSHLIGTTSDGEFSPRSYATRAQAALILHNFCKK